MKGACVTADSTKYEGTGSFEVKIGADTVKFTNVIITSIGERYLSGGSEMTIEDETKVPS